MTTDIPQDQAEHNRRTREAHDRLAPVWSATTDEGPFNGLLEHPALRALVPAGRSGATVLDAGCGSLRLFPEELVGLVGVPTFIVYRLLLRP